MHILTDSPTHPDYPQALCIAQGRKNLDMSCFVAGIDKVTGEYDPRSQIYNSDVTIGAQVMSSARPKWW